MRSLPPPKLHSRMTTPAKLTSRGTWAKANQVRDAFAGNP